MHCLFRVDAERIVPFSINDNDPWTDIRKLGKNALEDPVEFGIKVVYEVYEWSLTF